MTNEKPKFTIGDYARTGDTLVIVVGVPMLESNEGWCYGVMFVTPALEWIGDRCHIYRHVGEWANCFEKEMSRAHPQTYR